MIDSSSTDHIVFDRKSFLDFRNKNEVILSPNGGELQIEGVGKVLIEVFIEKRQKNRLH